MLIIDMLDADLHPFTTETDVALLHLLACMVLDIVCHCVADVAHAGDDEGEEEEDEEWGKVAKFGHFRNGASVEEEEVERCAHATDIVYGGLLASRCKRCQDKMLVNYLVRGLYPVEGRNRGLLT